MEMRAVTLAASHIFAPHPLSSSPSCQTLAFPASKSYRGVSNSQIGDPFLVEARRPRRSRSTSCPHGLSGPITSAVKLEQSPAVKEKAVAISSLLKGTSIFLVGMNCNMKTNIGMLLADALRYCYFDSDSLVERAVAGGSAPNPIKERDERSSQEHETEVLKQLSSMGRLVVSAGDGSVQNATNLAYLRYGISVWIDVPIDLLANEILKDKMPSSAPEDAPHSEPFSEVLQNLAKRYDEMKGRYGTADATISLQRVATQLGYDDRDSVTPEDMAIVALKEIEKLTRVKKMMEAAARPF